MIYSEFCEYLGSQLKVPTEINGFLVFAPETKNQKSNFMMSVCLLYDIMIFSEFCEYLALG